MNIKEMTLEEKIGQMLCLSFHGTEYNDQLKNLIEKHNIGTIIHFARNIVNLKQIYELNHQIHKNSKYPVFIGLDHEGGMVRRVMNDITYLPGAMALGNATDEELYAIYNQVGKELRNLGFNMNYMPTIDVNNNPYNPVINSRSYSDEPIMVAKKGKIAAKAMSDALMLPTPKHFPGHGNTNVDSHLGLPIVDSTKKELYEIELKPFQELIKDNVDGIMVAHILYKNIDSVYPSSISHEVITKLLKEEMGFKGLIITDSLTMKAIYNRYSIREIVKFGINAGNDIIMFCGEANGYDQETIINEFIDLVNTGEIPMERVNESVEKIISLKEKYKYTLGKNYLDNNDIDLLFNKQSELSKALTKRSITLYKDENNLLPIKEGEKVLSLFSKLNIASLVDNVDNEQISLGKYFDCDEIIYNDEKDFENIVQKTEKYDKIILATYNTNKESNQTQLFNLLDKNKLINVAVRSPFDLIHLKGCKTFVCTFDCSKESLTALAEVLKTNEFSDKLPINLNILEK